MAQVQVGGGGIDAEFDVERRALLELLAQVCLGDDLGGAEVMIFICSSTGSIASPLNGYSALAPIERC